MNDLAAALAAAAPWLVAPAIGIWRLRDTRSLADVVGDPPVDPPFVSVIVPARNEAHNIERCVRSILASNYPTFEAIVVDDHSTDGTGAVAARIAREDARLRVVTTPPLPDGWFGKQWACATGALASRGSLLLFTDADTTHAPTLTSRAVNALRASGASLLSVVGRQELGSFWERVVQPHVFSMLGLRYGGTERVNRSRRSSDKIANGQFILIDRLAYDRLDGHAGVRDHVAEDLALAQRFFAAGERTLLLDARDELSTRMYTSLAMLMGGWRKNVFAAGREAMPWGRSGQIIFPALLLGGPLLTIFPPAVLVADAAGLQLPAWALLAAVIATAAQLFWWVAAYRWTGAPWWYALSFPLGGLVFLVIAAQALVRGRRVAWKGREYLAR